MDPSASPYINLLEGVVSVTVVNSLSIILKSIEFWLVLILAFTSPFSSTVETDEAVNLIDSSDSSIVSAISFKVKDPVELLALMVIVPAVKL